MKKMSINVILFLILSNVSFSESFAPLLDYEPSFEYRKRQVDSINVFYDSMANLTREERDTLKWEAILNIDRNNTPFHSGDPDQQFTNFLGLKVIRDTVVKVIECDNGNTSFLTVYWNNGLPRTGRFVNCVGNVTLINYFSSNANLPVGTSGTTLPEFRRTEIKFRDVETCIISIRDALTGVIMIDTSLSGFTPTSIATIDLGPNNPPVGSGVPPITTPKFDFGDFHTLDISTLPDGLYFLSISNGNNLNEVKYIKSFSKK